MKTKVDQVLTQAREHGYHIESVEQLRTNRWLVTLKDPADEDILVLVQHRPVVGAADVQDLAELLRLRRFERGILLAIDGKFSPAAEPTARELSRRHIHLCTALPPNPTPPPAQPAFEAI